MTTVWSDGREVKGKSLPNQQRFIRRNRRYVEEAARKRISEGGIEEMGKNSTKNINIKTGGTDEPIFQQDTSGTKEYILPGNKHYSSGDTLKRPPGGQGRGSEGSSDGEGDDEFYFEVSQQEFLDYAFADMQLPDMIKRALAGDTEKQLFRAGFRDDGPPSKMDLTRSMRRALGRKGSLSTVLEERIGELDDERKKLLEIIAAGVASPAHRFRLVEVEKELCEARRQLEEIPYLDTFDLKFKHYELRPIPITRAVMFCLMDVSGSMEQWHKDMAKRFFFLLYLFLARNYEKVVVVFIRHTQYAKEVSEEEFFHSRETGGTVMSSALELTRQIIAKQYPVAEWNIYACQASDGDNWTDDNPIAYALMDENILPVVQYYAYVQVSKQPGGKFWDTVGTLRGKYGNLAMAHIADATDIYRVFRTLFERSKKEVA